MSNHHHSSAGDEAQKPNVENSTMENTETEEEFGLLCSSQESLRSNGSNSTQREDNARMSGAHNRIRTLQSKIATLERIVKHTRNSNETTVATLEKLSQKVLKEEAHYNEAMIRNNDYKVEKEKELRQLNDERDHFVHLEAETRRKKEEELRQLSFERERFVQLEAKANRLIQEYQQVQQQNQPSVVVVQVQQNIGSGIRTHRRQQQQQICGDENWDTAFKATILFAVIILLTFAMQWWYFRTHN